METATTFDLRPLTPTIGAVIGGIDCSRPLDPATRDAVEQAWLEHAVLFFRDQQLTPEQQTAFAGQFGPITTGHPIEPVLDGHPQVLPIDSRNGRTNFWHTDVTFMATPPAGSVLHAVTLPERGGDTMWASTRSAYDTLAGPLRDMCDRLEAYHYDEFYAARVAAGEGNDWDDEVVDHLLPVLHPVVRVHPVTGRPNLFVNPKFTAALAGFDAAQGHGLLDVLYDHMTQPEHVVRWQWRPGDVAFWDNRCTMHYGISDYGDALRVMHRVTLRGDRPVGPAA